MMSVRPPVAGRWSDRPAPGRPGRWRRRRARTELGRPARDVPPRSSRPTLPPDEDNTG